MAFVGLNAPHAAGLRVSRIFSAGLSDGRSLRRADCPGGFKFRCFRSSSASYFRCHAGLGFDSHSLRDYPDLLVEIQDELKAGLARGCFVWASLASSSSWFSRRWPSAPQTRNQPRDALYPRQRIAAARPSEVVGVLRHGSRLILGCPGRPGGCLDWQQRLVQRKTRRSPSGPLGHHSRLGAVPALA